MLFLPFAAGMGFVLSRWHGGGTRLPKIGHSIKSILFAAGLIGILSFLHPATSPYGWFWLIPCIGISSLGKATGHGGFMDLGTWVRPRRREALEWLIRPLARVVPEGLYDRIGLAVIGIASVSGALLWSFLFCPYLFPSILISGMAKGIVYRIRNGKPDTKAGEKLSGMLVYASACL